MHALARDHPQRAQTIEWSDFFPVATISWRVVNGRFAHTRTHARQSRGHLRLNAKAILREQRQNFSQQWRAKKFVSSFHVVDIKPGNLIA